MRHLPAIEGMAAATEALDAATLLEQTLPGRGAMVLGEQVAT